MKFISYSFMSHNGAITYETHGQSVLTVSHNRDVKVAVIFN